MRISDWSSDVCSSDLLVLFFQALLEGVDALTHVTHQLRNLAAAAEQDQHNGQHDEPVPDTKTSHSGIYHQIGRERSCAGLSQKGLAAAIFQRDRVNRLTTPGYAEKQRFAPGREQPRGVASRAAGNAPAPWHENGEPLPAIPGSAGGPGRCGP